MEILCDNENVLRVFQITALDKLPDIRPPSTGTRFTGDVWSPAAPAETGATIEVSGTRPCRT